MHKLLLAAFAVALLSLGGCASNLTDVNTMTGHPATDIPPMPVVKRVTAIPKHQLTYDYGVTLFPGLGEDFNPNPTMTPTEYLYLSQLDWYCAKQTDKVRGRLKEMMKQGITLGALEGLFGALGYHLAFGVSPHNYLTAIGLTATGGGLASGSITFSQVLHGYHGYCMVGMIHKADELDGRLRRLWAVPLPDGEAPLPTVSAAPVPDHPGMGNSFMPPQ